MKKIKILFGVVFLIFITIIIITIHNFNEKTQNNDTLKVAIVMPFSGELAVFGSSVYHGVELALKQSGLSSSSVQIVTEDTAGFTTSGALTAWKRAVEVDHAKVIIGPFGPAQTLTVAPTIDIQSPMVVVSVSNCDDQLKQYKNIFCIYPGLKDQVSHSLGFMKEKSWKNIYLITENSEFGILVENMLKESSQEITLLGTEKIVPNQTRDFRTLIAKAVAKKPDVVFTMLAPNEGLIMLRQYQSLSKDIPLYISTDVNVKQLVDLFGTEASGVFFAARLSEVYNSSFNKEYILSYNSNPDYFAALTHSATTILFDRFNKNRKIENLLQNMVEYKNSSTAVEDFKFRTDRTVSVPLHTYIFKDSNLQQVF